MTSTPSSKPSTEGPAADAPAGGPLGALLEGAVDYAGLFPPARLAMELAVAAYTRHARGPRAWMLGSFVVPLARAGELARAVARLPAARRVKRRWPVALLCPEPLAALRALERAGGSPNGLLRVTAWEMAPAEPAAIGESRGAAPDGVAVFHEVPLDGALEDRLDAVAEAGAAAKVRTGGVTADAFPGSEPLARFLVGCAARGLAFKATAGLHHAFPGEHRLTYESASPTARMYGFLQLALVAELVRSRGAEVREAAALLAEDGPRPEVRSGALLWRGLRFEPDALRRLRRTFFRSFGSCSFDEPVAELLAAGLLEGAAEREVTRPARRSASSPS